MDGITFAYAQPDRLDPSREGSGTRCLGVRGLTVRFETLTALDSVSFDIDRGQVFGIVGAGGAGKTTLLDCLSRRCVLQEGEIHLDGRPISTAALHDVIYLNTSRRPHEMPPWVALPVRECIRVAIRGNSGGGFLARALGPLLARASARDIDRRVEEIIHDLDLTRVADIPAIGLSFSTHRIVEIARALARDPKLLLLDDPAAGLHDAEIIELGRAIQAVRNRRKTTVLLTSRNMDLVMRVADHVAKLHAGRLVGEVALGQVDRRSHISDQ